MVAAAATLAVVYPHMNSLGGDGFWLIRLPGKAPLGIDACGRAAQRASAEAYAALGLTQMPIRGSLAACTVAGTLSGWQRALAISHGLRPALPLSRLLRDAIEYAEHGCPVAPHLAATLAAKSGELSSVPGFGSLFLPQGAPPAAGSVWRQPALAQTLKLLVREGLDSFYRGSLGRSIAADLTQLGSPLREADLLQHQASTVTPLTVNVREGQLFNLPAPTQGMASLLILALFDRLPRVRAESFEHLHGLIECTKAAFVLRDQTVTDPGLMRADLQGLLADGEALDALVRRIQPRRAAPWPAPPSAGDTVWAGCADDQGCVVSFIQSIYFEFGSGVVLPSSGITWQNRGASFRLQGTHNRLRPLHKPFHTLNPAMAQLTDGRWLAYGTMGGEGQPQTQAAVFTRYAKFGQSLQQAIDAPRWLLGRTWGDASVNLKLESRIAPALSSALERAGHAVERVADFSSVMGHAGAVVMRADGSTEGASDPRCDGAALAV